MTRRPGAAPTGAAVALLASTMLLSTAVRGQTPDPSPPLAPAVDRQSPSLSVVLSPQEVTVGDRVAAVLTLTVPAASLDGEPTFPNWEERWGDAEIFEAEDAERIAELEGAVTFRQRLEIASFRPGDIALPRVPVIVPLLDGPIEIETPEDLTLTIASVLPEEEEAESLQPRPPAPPRELPIGAAFWWTASMMSACALALAMLAWSRRETAGAAAKARLGPFPELQNALEALGDGTLAPEACHERLSLAWRRYLGRSLGFPAAESTTSEVHKHLRLRHLPARLTPGTRELLTACDLVKFARRPSDLSEVQERASTVRELGKELEAYLHPVSTDPASAPGDLRTISPGPGGNAA